MSFAASATLAALSNATAVEERDDKPGKVSDLTRGQRDLYTQFVISSALGLGAFFSFCVCLLIYYRDLFSFE